MLFPAGYLRKGHHTERSPLSGRELMQQ